MLDDSAVIVSRETRVRRLIKCRLVCRIGVATFLALTIALPAGTALAARGPGMLCTANPEADLLNDFIGDSSAVIVNRSTLCSYQVGIAAYRILSGNPNDPNDILIMTAVDSIEQEKPTVDQRKYASANAPRASWI